MCGGLSKGILVLCQLVPFSQLVQPSRDAFVGVGLEKTKIGGSITMKILGNFFVEQSKHLERNSTDHLIFLFASSFVNVIIGPN